MPASKPTASDEPSPNTRNGSSDGHVGETVHSGDLHQTLLREVNERIEHMNLQWGPKDRDSIMCECGHPDCMEKIEIGAVDYERVRRFPTRFVVKPGHVTGGSERIVEQAYGYDVVEKFGRAATAAIRLDPRRLARTKKETLR